MSVGPVKGIASATELETIHFEIAGVGYEIQILKDPPARVWNDLKTVKPGESPFDQDTRVLDLTVQAWDLGVDLGREAFEDLQEPVRHAMVQVVTTYYAGLQKQFADVLAHIYRPGGDGAPTDPSPGSATASGSRARSTGSRRTR